MGQTLRRAITKATLLLHWRPALGASCFILLLLPLAAGVGQLSWQGLAPAAISQLLSQPALFHSSLLSLWIGAASSVLSLLLCTLILAFSSAQEVQGGFLARHSERLLAPLLATPHVAFAIGLAFLIAPSGWLVRAISPALSGFNQPPDWQSLNDPYGLALIVALVIKETPFLLLMAYANLDPQMRSRQLWLGASLGFSSRQMWWRLILPPLWPHLRLPLYAIAAYSLAVVDIAQLLGPNSPAPLAVRLWLWYQDPDISWRAVTASGAFLLLALTALLLIMLRLLEWGHLRFSKAYWLNGQRKIDRPWPRQLLYGLLVCALLINAAVIITLLLWSITQRWPFPLFVPNQWGLHYWQELLPNLWPIISQTSLLTLLSTTLALLLAVLSFEAQLHTRPWPLWLICLPLLLPQASLLFGMRFALDWLAGEQGFGWVLWSHLIFVFPYLYLCLHGPYLRFDSRISYSAYLLGASPWRTWWRIKAPLLAKPLCFAFAVGASVSLAQYLPTLLFGAGRVITLTTEAVAIGSGLNRRLAGVYGLLQWLLPLLIYGLALRLPHRLNPALNECR